ncbi:hypothetical protein RhiJN_09437 [Ceratobasidium sp. AG-Ba]|nr:hypothetical protein RhiJN_09437 [Ceratobasidium sp. AG-Ba]
MATSSRCTASVTGSARPSPQLGHAPLPDMAQSFLYGSEDCTKLDHLYSYLVSNAVNDSTPPAFHGALERLQNNIFDKIPAAETRILLAVGAMLQGTPAQSPHRETTPQHASTPVTEQETPKPMQGTGSNDQDFRVPTNFGSDGPSGSHTLLKSAPAGEEDDKHHLHQPTSPLDQSAMEFDPLGTSTPGPTSWVTFQ